MLILDVCCGAEKIYQGWQKAIGDDFVSVDIRKGDFSYKHEQDYAKHEIVVKPTVLADMGFLPFKDGCIDGIVCDPPHLECGEQSYSYKYYGSWSETDAVRNLRFMDPEFNRVLRERGFLILKIMYDRKNIYLTMLKHFAFFLPIPVKRSRGTYKNPKSDTDGALWLIGYKKEISSIPF